MEAFVPRTDVRDMCSADRCGKYGASWACPPGCGTLEQAAADIARCSSGLLVQTTGTLDGDFDYEGMQAIAQRHKRSSRASPVRQGSSTPTASPSPPAPAPCARGVPTPTSPAASRPGVLSSMEAVRPVGQRRLPPFGTRIQLRKGHHDLHLMHFTKEGSACRLQRKYFLNC